MLKIIINTIVGFTLLFSTVSLASKNDDFNNPIPFEQWKQYFAIKAKNKGVTEKTLKSSFYNIKRLPKVILYDRRQPEFSRTFVQYITSALSSTRRSKARAMYKKHKVILDKLAKKYGVQPRFLIAFWGLETNFGEHTGKMDIIRSLATLSHDLRRSDFFTNELILALKIIQNGHITANKFRGSWAGAFGQTQFMPSTFTAYAIDGNGDGKKDLWNSFDDIFSSSSNFLSKVGWKKGETWGREVKINNTNFNWALSGHKIRKTLSQWDKMGVVRADGGRLDTSYTGTASLVIPSGANGPKFLIYNNFRRILNWNRSDYYALAVGLLANDIVGLPKMTWKPNPNEKALSRIELKTIQEFLNKKGFYNYAIDGFFGSVSKRALKKYQISVGLIPDGYASFEVLNFLKVQQK